ncbi:MAG: hypothetical protein HQM10_15955 [Candidatus Riflebacteria bacterium]|nr:hypothetical protein [Candidatus Riflebacteria bacterium]
MNTQDSNNEQLKTLLREAEIINTIIKGITGKKKIDDFIQETIDSALEYTRVDVIGLGLVNKSTNKIDGYWVSGIPYNIVREAGKGSIDLTNENEISVIAIRERNVQICNDALNDPRVTKAIVEITGTKSFAIFPLVVSDEPIGFMGFEHRKEKVKIDYEDLKKFQRFVDTLALFFHNYKIYDELDNLNKNLENLVEIKVGELKDAHETIWNIKEYLAAIIENSVNGIIATDVSGKIQITNRVAKELFGEKLGIGSCSHISSLFQNEDKSRFFKDNVPDFFPENEKLIKNIEIEMQDSEEKPVYSNLAVVSMHDRNKGQQGILFMIQDLREIRFLEGRIIQAEKLKLFGEMAAGITHELNTPLGTIKGAVAILKRKLPEDSELALKYLPMINDAVNRCSSFLRDMLDFSKPSKIYKSTVSIAKLVHHAIEIIKLKSASAEIHWEYDFAEPLPELSANKENLMQVFLNILDNAVAACKENGKISIRVFAEKANPEEIARRNLPPRRVDDSEHREFYLFRKTREETFNKLPSNYLPDDLLVTTTISDNGVGISPENIMKIFEVFFTSGKENRGTGLGLAISQRIINEHNGAIFVYSIPGKETTFTVKLPVNSCSTNPERIVQATVTE